MFGVLKERFCRKRGLLKKISVSGSGSGKRDVSDAQRDLNQYSFLGWLAPFVSQRNTQTNLSTESIKGDDSDENDEDGLSEPDTFRESTRIEDKDSDNESVASVRSKVESKRKTERSVKTSGHRMKKPKQADVIDSEMTMMKNMSQVLEYKLERHRERQSDIDDQDDIFGRMIASELKNFPDQVKHELNSIIYKYRMQGFSSSIVPSPSAASPVFPTQSQPSTQSMQSSQGFSAGSWLSQLKNY